MFEDEVGSGELVGLKEIRLPEPIPYTPDTTAWWVLFAVLLLLVGWIAFALWRRWRRAAYRRAALAELGLLRASFASDRRRPAAVAALPVLLKRTALAAWPRPAVASLTGDAWVAFLDSASQGGFDTGQGVLLQRAAYGSADEMTVSEAEALSEGIETWIRGHRV